MYENSITNILNRINHVETLSFINVYVVNIFSILVIINHIITLLKVEQID